MLVKNFMRTPIVSCTPWDTAHTAASLMKTHSVGALLVVADKRDPLLEGIVTDRDLCCNALAAGQGWENLRVVDVMTPVPVTCEPDHTLEECLELMRENQIRRIPVVDENGRCVGIVSVRDIASHASAQQLATTFREILKSATMPSKSTAQLDNQYFYCGQLHELDQIALLKRRREHALQEVCI